MASCMATAARTARTASSSCTRDDAESGEHTVTQQLDDGAVVGLDRRAERGVVAGHHAARRFGVDSFVQGRGADEVGEHQRDDTTGFGVGRARCGGRRRRRATRRTSHRIGRRVVLGATRGAAGREAPSRSPSRTAPPPGSLFRSSRSPSRPPTNARQVSLNALSWAQTARPPRGRSEWKCGRSARATEPIDEHQRRQGHAGNHQHGPHDDQHDPQAEGLGDDDAERRRSPTRWRRPARATRRSRHRRGGRVRVIGQVTLGRFAHTWPVDRLHRRVEVRDQHREPTIDLRVRKHGPPTRCDRSFDLSTYVISEFRR